MAISPMVLTAPELLASLETEVRILRHLAGKADRAKLEYRPTPGQRSTIELLRYLTYMGPALLRVAQDAVFDARDRKIDAARAHRATLRQHCPTRSPRLPNSIRRCSASAPSDLLDRCAKLHLSG